MLRLNVCQGTEEGTVCSCRIQNNSNTILCLLNQPADVLIYQCDYQRYDGVF